MRSERTSGIRPADEPVYDIDLHRDWFLSLVAQPPGGAVLDLGCGRGADLLTLAANNPDPHGIDADLDGRLSSVAVTLAPHAQLRLGGEAFESLDRGMGASVALGFRLDERYAVQGRFAATRNSEAFPGNDDRTTTLDILIDVRAVRNVVGLEIEVGPAVGYARLSRPLYVLPIHGFLVGLGASASRPLAGGLHVVLGLDASWTSFSDPPIAVPTPPGFEPDAEGSRVSLSLGLSQRWRR